jgi:hypothetical protein
VTDSIDPGALAGERERLAQLQQSLRVERERVRAESAVEIARTQAELRRAAQQAAERERELEALQTKLERKLADRRFTLRRRREPEVDPGLERAAHELDLTDREQALKRWEELLRTREQQVADRERRLTELARQTPRPQPPRPAPPPRRPRPTGGTEGAPFADGLRALGGSTGPEAAAEDGAGSW